MSVADSVSTPGYHVSTRYFVMTKKTADNHARCLYCRRVLPERSGPGRKKVYCRQACRQWDWVGRQRARELKISEDELVVTRRELDALYDDLYVLACAVDDTTRELSAQRQTAASLRESLEWLLDAARPLRDRTLAPSVK